MINVKTIFKSIVVFAAVSQKDRFWRWIRSMRATSDIDKIVRTLVPDVPQGSFSVEELLQEIRNESRIRERVEMFNERYPELWAWSWEKRMSGRQFSRVVFLYLLLRVLRPDVVVETGCFTGWTSTLILAALNKNGKGHLWTIDLPARAGERSMDLSLPADLEPGFLVPDYLKERWTLLIGDVRDVLPKLLSELGQVDVFYHDSDHTYAHMIWEYATVWPYLRANGLIISDDIAGHTAFWDWALATKSEFVLYSSDLNFGALRKQG